MLDSRSYVQTNSLRKDLKNESPQMGLQLPYPTTTRTRNVPSNDRISAAITETPETTRFVDQNPYEMTHFCDSRVFAPFVRRRIPTLNDPRYAAVQTKSFDSPYAAL